MKLFAFVFLVLVTACLVTLTSAWALMSATIVSAIVGILVASLLLSLAVGACVTLLIGNPVKWLKS